MSPSAPANPAFPDQPQAVPVDDNEELHGGAAKLVEWEKTQLEKDPERPQELKGLTGLAISGGGIRSASFGLGILQAFAERQRLHFFDYLSSVSGGGYIGSALSWMLHKTWEPQGQSGNRDPDGCESGGKLRFDSKAPCFPFTSPAGNHSRGSMGRIHTALLRHMRQNGNYLTPGRGLNIGSLAAVVLRGTVVSLFAYLPILILAMLMVHIYVVSEAPTGLASSGPFVAVIGGTALLALLVTGIAWWRRSVLTSVERMQRWKQFLDGIGPHVIRTSLWVTGFGALALLLLKLAGVQEFEHLFRFAAVLVVLGVLASLIYAAASGRANSMDRRWYEWRQWFEIRMGGLLGLIALVLLFASLPLVDQLITAKLAEAANAKGNSAPLGATIAALGALFSGSAYLESTRAKVRKLPLAIQVWLGAGLLVYGLMLLAYNFSVPVYENIRDIYVALWVEQTPNLATDPAPGWCHLAGDEGCLPLTLFVGWISLALLLARFTEVNYLSVHRYYRDRLMETFMPDPTRVLAGNGRETPEANTARISDMCGGLDGKVSRPYHLVNTNVLLADSGVPKFKARGGDNFLLSPRFCGSQATGWVPTEHFMGNRMTLATAMAISGAAANPNAGVGGEGVTRNPALSFLMSLLNIRLGFWAPNPAFARDAGYPDLLEPGLGELLRYGLDEKGRYVQLSDGGHFENLGVYELIRRQVRLIICSDAGADPEYQFGDLGNLVEKVRVDFGAIIAFKEPLDKLVPPEDGGVAEKGYLEADIRYRDGSQGLLIYLKSTWLEGLSADLTAYKRQHKDFPDQTTADQFFGERQFEAYRELGYQTAWFMLEDLEDELFPSPGRPAAPTDSVNTPESGDRQT